jgi:hypothetical protein
MAVEVPGRSDGTRRAAADMSVKADYQYRFVIVDATGRAARTTGAGAAVYGVLQNDPGLNQAATIMIDGMSKMRSGAAVAVGAPVTTDNVGRVVEAETGDQILGTCLVASAAEGEIISVQLDRQGLMV